MNCPTCNHEMFNLGMQIGTASDYLWCQKCGTIKITGLQGWVKTPHLIQKHFAAVECLKCKSTTSGLMPIDADHPGFICPKCYADESQEYPKLHTGQRVQYKDCTDMQGTVELVILHDQPGRVLIKWDGRLGPVSEDPRFLEIVEEIGQ